MKKEKDKLLSNPIANLGSPIIITKSNDNDKGLKSSYSLKYISLDVLLFLFAAWAEFGFALLTRKTTLASIDYPVEHYLFPYLTSQQEYKFSIFVNRFSEILAFSDALLTTITISNMKNCREELLKDLSTSVAKYKENAINPVFLIVNLFLTFGTFIIGSFSSWAGLDDLNFSRQIINIAGVSMFLGFMVINAMINAPYIFSNPKKLADFYNLPRDQKIQILNNIFFTKKGLFGLVPSSAINIINRSWTFYGLGRLITNHVFHTQNPYIEYSYALLGSVCSAYQTLMSQSIKDYQATFKENIEIKEIQYENSRLGACQRWTRNFLSFIIMVLIAEAFLLRTLFTPSLYTGEIDNPQENYGYKETAISIVGLLCGGYAAFQYSRFMYSRCQDGLTAFFRPRRFQLSSVKININEEETPFLEENSRLSGDNSFTK